MKITKIEPINLQKTVLVKIYTDEGITGIGEASPMNPPIVCSHISESLAPMIVGMDPFDVEAIVEKMIVAQYKIAGQTQAMAGAGIDIACWDIMGKALNKPIYKLLGGAYRTEIEVYASSMRRDITPEDEAKRMYDLREKYGYTAGKIRAGKTYGFDQDQWPGRTKALVTAVREAMGDDFKLMVDGNSCYSAARAIELGRFLEQKGIWHFEEPCPYFDLESTAKVAKALDMPVAGGEQDWDLHVFKEMLVKEAVDILQPDIIKCYGFTHAKKIAALADAFGVFITVHNAQPNLGSVATLHFAAATPACRYPQEFGIEPHPLRDRLYEPKLEVVNGKIAVPSGPGLGVTINEDVVKEMRVG